MNQKDIKFTKEYLNLNNLYTSLICYVKIFNAYDRGCLTVSNKNIIVELNKKLIKLKNQSFSDISESKIKNKSTEKELPNYLVNDTIDKILTGKIAEKEKKKKYNYILNINLDLVTCKLIVHKEKQNNFKQEREKNHEQEIQLQLRNKGNRRLQGCYRKGK